MIWSPKIKTIVICWKILTNIKSRIDLSKINLVWRNLRLHKNKIIKSYKTSKRQYPFLKVNVA